MMKDKNKTKAQLIDELAAMQQRFAELEATEARCKQMEMALRESEKRFSRLSEAAFEGIALSDKGYVIDVNNRLAKLLGYEPAELIGKRAIEFVAPESRDLVLKNIMSGSEDSYEHIALRKDGSTVPVEVQGKNIPFQGGTIRVTAIRDITRRKRSEEEVLRRNRELTLLNRVIAASATSLEQEVILQKVCCELIKTFDLSQGIAVLANEEKTAVKVVAEHQPKDRPSLLGQTIPVTNNPLFEYLISHRTPLAAEDAQNDPRLASIKHLLEYRSTVSALMFPLIVKDEIIGGLSLGADKFRSFSDDEISLVRSVAEQVAGALARARLDEERRQLEEQHHQAQKMEAIGQLTAGIAHDFNNLLQVINGFTTLLQYELRPDDPRQEMVDKVIHAGQHAANLIRQLLVFSRKQIIKPQVLDINTIVLDTNKMLQRIIGEDIQIETILAPDLWWVKIDQTQLEQLIVNLAINARDAMPNGGKLTIETSNIVLDKNYTGNHLEVQPGEHVVLAISDTGLGMSQEVQEHIFEPFYTTKEYDKGTGLGLATVYGIVKQNQGSIWVYSEMGQGTVFKIYLRRVKEASVYRPAQSDQIEELPSGTETVLLVEDHPGVREMVVWTLGRQGYTVLEATNSSQALRLLEEYGETIHLLLTDVVMPEMSGKSLADYLQTIRPNTQVLFMSGYTDEAIVHHGVLDAGVAFIQKPFSTKELVHKVYSVLAERTFDNK